MTARATASEPSVGQAPGTLVVLQAFVNTLDIEKSADQLRGPAALAGWLRASGLAAAGPIPDSAVGPADLRLARELREALRGVLRSHVTHSPAPAVADPGDPAGQLARIAAGLDTRFVVGPGGRVRLAPAGSGVQAALSELLLIAAEAATEGRWQRLKACGADDCQWAFYDRSPTRNGCWCSMQVCGSRAKSRAYRERAAAGRRAVLGVEGG
jgi:predicted RNA-binding Zn ribbon-like protein